jgi:hypothetical protein
MISAMPILFGGETDLLEAALSGLQHRKNEIENKMDEIRRMLGNGHAASSNGTSAVHHRKPLSAAARNRIAAAQRKRWAAFRRARKS